MTTPILTPLWAEQDYLAPTRMVVGYPQVCDLQTPESIGTVARVQQMVGFWTAGATACSQAKGDILVDRVILGEKDAQRHQRERQITTLAESNQTPAALPSVALAENSIFGSVRTLPNWRAAAIWQTARNDRSRQI